MKGYYKYEESDPKEPSSVPATLDSHGKSNSNCWGTGRTPGLCERGIQFSDFQLVPGGLTCFQPLLKSLSLWPLPHTHCLRFCIILLLRTFHGFQHVQCLL